MPATRTRRVLAACVASNAVFACVGLATLQTGAAVASVAAATPSARVTAAPSAVTAPPTTPAPPRPSTPPPPSSRAPPFTAAPTTSPAPAADDVTGISSSAAPPSDSRIAPDAGSYPATFSGSAKVNGRAQSFPSTGSMVFAAAAPNLRQSSPDTPGNVVLTQRFTAAKSSLVSFQMKAGDTTKVFTPVSPVTFVMFNAPQGTSWTWSATSTDGATRVTANGSVGATQVTNVNGQDVPTVAVTTTFTISGDMAGTAELTMWVSPSHRLPVVQRQVINATARSGYGFSTRLVSDVTQRLTRLTPR